MSFNPLFVILVFCIYMAVLFATAILVEKKVGVAKRVVNNPLVYSLGMAVYCTAWTYYGSVGKAATSGMLFLTIYLGPTLMIIFWWTILRKLVRIKSEYRITSIADFISARYHKSLAIAAIVTVIAFFGTMPYIALQFKAIFSTFGVITHAGTGAPLANVTYIVVGLMILFTIMFGIRHLDPTERHQGMMAAVAVENTVQLFAFLVAGIFVCFFLYGGFGDVFRQFAAGGYYREMRAGGEYHPSFMLWSTYLLLAMSAIMCLPRQFHTQVVENTDERHIRTAMWVFPLYMFLINIFVLPIAMAGILKGYALERADDFVLLLPLNHGTPWVALFVFLGGFSAATSMIMIASMTMATMITNHLLLPLMDWFSWLAGLRRHLLKCRWAAAAVFIFSGFMFAQMVGESYMLVNIGLIAFAAVFQFAPALLGGIFWRRANKTGAMLGLCAGFLVWFYTMLVPALVRSGWLAESLLESGPWGMRLLSPEALFGVTVLDPLTHSVFWSLVFNGGFFILGSFFYKSREEERRMADEFVDVLKESRHYLKFAAESDTVDLSGKVTLFEGLLARYFSIPEAKRIIQSCVRAAGLEKREKISVVELAGLQNMAERMLAGAVGSAAAHKTLRESSLFTSLESRELSRQYADILADLKVTPQELKNKVDFYQERTNLLTQHAVELADKIRELEEQIQERRKAEQALKDSENRWKTLLNSTPAGVIVVDKETHKIIYANPVVAEMTGFSEDKLTGELCRRIICPAVQGKCPITDEGQIYERAEHQLIRVDGTMIPVLKNVTTVMLAGKECLIESFLDITERKKAEEELKKAMELKLKFVSMVSHELRTPLTAIKEGISIVHSGIAGFLNIRQKDFLHEVKKSVDRLSRLINDVLDFQKLEARKMLFNIAENDLNEVIRETIEIMTPQAQKKGLYIRQMLEERVPKIKFDRDRLIQVLSNLIDNAVRFTDAGGITVSVKTAVDAVEVRVHNTGPDISPEDVSRLFLMFEQLESYGKTKTEGTGLGLAICKDIIEQHGGKIWAESSAGKGTVFAFVLPRQRQKG